MEKRNIEATREALLNAAEKLMTECSDPFQVTSRAITKEAGVNLAMINYCFGSREALLFEVFGRLKSEAQLNDPEFSNIIKGELSPKEKLIQIHLRTMKLMLRYFNYSKALTKYVLLNREIAAERGSLSFITDHFGNRKTEAECRLIAFEISSLHELAVLRHEEIKNVCGIDLTDDAQLEKYIINNINKFLD
ncbi:MAG: TetR/AcrR family transcriptional regulator [Oscillospiraceae bacterium]|nr:TetR/AcrR family transcriptional regulator [Oscillospiraceae bacterium]